MSVFESILNNKHLKNTTMIVFLNKTDLMKKMYKLYPVKKYCPEYTGNEEDFDKVCDFFMKKYQLLNLDPNREIYSHYTHATDKQSFTIVIKTVIFSILKKNLGDNGLL